MILQSRQFYIHLLLQSPLWLRLCNSFPFDLLFATTRIHQKFPLLRLRFATIANCERCIFISTFYHNLFEHFKTHEGTGKTVSLFCLIFSGQKWDLKVKISSVGGSAWLMHSGFIRSKQSGFNWSNKITERLDMNIHKWSPGSYSQVHTLESVCTLQVSMLLMGFYPQWCHLSPATTSVHERIPLAWWCPPLAPEPACLCHFLSFLCCVRPALAGMWHGKSLWPFLFCRVWNITDNFCWMAP